MNKNYYLVNKETNVIHAYFRANSALMKPQDKVNTTLSGNFYIPSNPELTLKALQNMRYTSDDYQNVDWQLYYKEHGFGSIIDPFVFIADVHIVSYKGYRIFKFSKELVQLSHDFANNQLFELMAFISTLFKEYIGDKEYAEWAKTFRVVDQYGVNELIMSHFTIEADDNELIYDSEEISDVPGADKKSKQNKTSIAQLRYL